MPSVLVPVKGLYETVLRPIAHKVADDVKRWTGMPKDVPIRIYNESGFDHNPGSAIDDEKGKRLQFGAGSKVTITVTERYKEDAVIGSPVRTPDEPFIFLDKALNIMMKPVRSYNTVIMAFEYRAKTKHEAEAWRNDIKVRLAEDRQALLHEVIFHYEVPMLTQEMLAHFHELRERQAGYGEDLATWFNKCFTPRSTVLTNSNAAVSHRVVNEHSIGLQGWFDFSELEEAYKRTDNPTWTITFNYQFNYQKPVEVNFVYPPLIHNQRINAGLLNKKPRYRLEDRPRNEDWPRSRANYESVADMHRKPTDPLSGRRIPLWDEWVPVHVPPGTLTIASWMIQVLPEDPTLVLDLKNMGRTKFSDIYLNYFKCCYKHLTTRGGAVIHFGAFRGTEPLVDEALYIDENLVMRTRVPMDLRRDYHVRMSMLMDKAAFLPQIYHCANLHPDMLIDLWETVEPELDGEALKPHIPFNKDIWDWYYDYIGVKPGDYHTSLESVQGHFIDRRRVQTLTIILNREEA